jgi:S-adenosylmethionine:tRNA ribosyltransferase-isomerase
MSELQLSDFNYDLPPELIAQHPVTNRDQARMLVLPRPGGEIAHRHVRDIMEYRMKAAP